MERQRKRDREVRSVSVSVPVRAEGRKAETGGRGSGDRRCWLDVERWSMNERADGQALEVLSWLAIF